MHLLIKEIKSKQFEKHETPRWLRVSYLTLLPRDQSLGRKVYDKKTVTLTPHLTGKKKKRRETILISEQYIDIHETPNVPLLCTIFMMMCWGILMDACALNTPL